MKTIRVVVEPYNERTAEVNKQVYQRMLDKKEEYIEKMGEDAYESIIKVLETRVVN